MNTFSQRSREIICRELFVVAASFMLTFTVFPIMVATTKSRGWQASFLWTCVFQLMVDVVFYETLEVAWIQFAVPML